MSKGSSSSLKSFMVFLLSHHSTCETDHIFHIGSISICRGCFSSYLGYLNALIILFGFSNGISFWWVLTAPFVSLFIVLLPSKRKKNSVLRFLQGFLLFLTLIFPTFLEDLILRLISFMIVLFFIFMYVKRSRHAIECNDSSIPY
ncbi:MAG: hypothetical protein D6732_26375 [Methanobacteriota archaeon]|nr:MAG: hypothetical protein D6732_26375 [Euryarchaeota archaeon]